MLCIWFGNAEVGSGTPSPVESTVKPVTCGPTRPSDCARYCGSASSLLLTLEPADDALPADVAALRAARAWSTRRSSVTSRRLLFLRDREAARLEVARAVGVVADAALQVHVADHAALAARLGAVDHRDRVLAAVRDEHAPPVGRHDDVPGLRRR